MYHLKYYNLQINIAGLGILYVKPRKRVPELFSFLSPLSVTVWLSILAANFLVSLTLYFNAKISLHDSVCHSSVQERIPKKITPKTSPDRILEPSIRFRGEQEFHADGQGTDDNNNISLAKYFWFISASLLQQGIDIAPE